MLLRSTAISLRSTAVSVWAAALLAGPVAADGPLRAEQITRATAPDLLIGGPDAIGGVGDWYLANDVVEVIVDDPGRRHAKLNHGGTIVDAGLRDRTGEDQFARLFPLLNLDQRVFANFDAMRAEVNEAEGWARLVVASTGGMSSLPRGGWLRRTADPLVPDPEDLRGVRIQTEYAVYPGEPFVHITTTLRNDGDSDAPVFSYGDVWMRGGRSMRAWVGNSVAPAVSAGFHHKSFDRANLLGSSDAMAAFTYVSLPGTRSFPPIAYALVAPDHAEAGRTLFGVTGEHVTFANAFVQDFDWDELSLFRLGRAVFTSLAPGEVWSYRRRLLVAGRADVAATTDVLFPLLGVADGKAGVEGRVLPAGLTAVVEVNDAATGAPVTQLAADPTGSFRAVLPPGSYTLSVRADQREERTLRAEVSDGVFHDVGAVRFEDPGWLVFARAFADSGPGRIIAEGLGETPTPVFEPELLDFRIDGEPAKSGTETNQLYFVGNERDPGRVALPPGRYRLTATRGIEHDIASVEVTVAAGEETPVEPFSVPRVVTVPGHVPADFHVHAQASDDSGMSNEVRLRSFVAEDVEVIVSTDHDHLGNFEPALDALGVRDRIRVIQGVEITSSAPSGAAPWTLGHHIAWPLPLRALEHRQGAPPSQDLGVAELYALLRRDYGARVVQLNHPRDGYPTAIDEGAYFTHLGSAGEAFDPARPIEEAPNSLLLASASDGRTRAVDFDAMEVMNGRDHGEYLLQRDDWHSLLRQGYRRTGTANSDTHGPGQLAGYPRNYVQLDVPDAGAPSPLDAVAFDAAIRAGRLFGTTGPLITAFTANGGRAGDLVSAKSGAVTVEFEVAAAPWVPVEEVRLLVNGELRELWRDLPANEVVRLRGRAPLVLERDAFVTVEAGAPLDVDPDVWSEEHGGWYARVAPRFVPEAFSNPIFVDVDGNGRFDAPGLAPRTIAAGWEEWGMVALAFAALGLGTAMSRRRQSASRT